VVTGPELPRPLGFPGCPECAYLNAGSPEFCLACARQSIASIGPDACSVCSQAPGPDGRCRNRLCRVPTSDRAIDRIHAIGVYSGDLEAKIKRYKYENAWGWKYVFGRLVTGWLQQKAAPWEYDLILANPTYVEPGSGRDAHTEQVVRAAAAEDQLGVFPFDVGDSAVIVKTRATPRSAGGSWQAKQQAARAHADVLAITRPEIVAGAKVLLYDDVCTTGQQLEEVARLLKRHGAVRVEALVLARAPWS
jgi:predicted amidophosphoribosyltransferase